MSARFSQLNKHGQVELPLSLTVQLDQGRLESFLERIVEGMADAVAARVLAALEKRVDQPEKTVRAAELAKLLSVTPRTVANWARQGMPRLKNGHYLPSECKAWMRESNGVSVSHPQTHHNGLSAE